MALQEKAPNVIAVYTTAPWESSLAVLRIVGPAQQAGLQMIRGNDGADISLAPVSLADVVVLQRDWPRYLEAYEKITAQARTEGKPIVYETDDLLLELPENHIDKSRHSQVLFPVMRAVVEADVITSNSPLICAYLRAFNPHTLLLPNYLNDRLWTFRVPPSPDATRIPIVIGYMGGDTHLPDLEYIAPVLLRLLQRYGERVQIRFWGSAPPTVLASHPRVEWVPMNEPDYATFATRFAKQESDIFLGPLCDNLLNRCKSSIKFLEYSVLGVPGVYSHIAPYESVVVHGENGFLASTLDEWEEYLSRLIEIPALRYEMGLRAQQTVREQWLLSRHAHEWVEVYKKAFSVMGNRSPVQQAAVFARVAQQVQRRHQELEQTVAGLKAKVAEQEHQVQVLQTQLTEILNTRSWRLMQRLQRLRLRVVPLKSRRARLLDWLLRLARL